jgi:hypothetical protein
MTCMHAYACELLYAYALIVTCRGDFMSPETFFTVELDIRIDALETNFVYFFA